MKKKKNKSLNTLLMQLRKWGPANFYDAFNLAALENVRNVRQFTLRNCFQKRWVGWEQFNKFIAEDDIR